MSIEVEYNYNADEHYAPPIRIQWMARNAKRLTQMRWIFIHCCGQIGNVNGRNISSRFPCKFSSGRIIWNVTRRHHASQLQLLRTSHSHIIKYTPPLARWRCCHREIAAWDDAWSSRDRKIPFQYVDSGCLEGMYDCEAEPELDPNPYNFPTALVAIPLHRKPKTTATKKRSHSSSGLQTVVIEKNKLLDPHMINFTQNSVLKLFSDKNRPSIVETAVLILKGNMKIDDIPTIRVASRSNSEADDFYTADNRRLFLHKILGTKGLRVDWIQWTTEFDGKLNQNIRFDPQARYFVSKDAIIECRNDCYKRLLIDEGKTMDPGKIKFTKSSISTRFNDKELPSLLDTALMILRGEMMIEDIPTIMVATRSNIESDNFYTLDNRRLFLFKLLNIKKVKVDWVEWIPEFDEKLNQNITCTRPDLRFSVGKDGIADCRNYCYEYLLIEKGKTMDPRTIEFTKSSILKYFNDLELPSLLETALMILRGKMMIEEIPTIRVATRGGSENYIFYTIDNRRLFLFKLLNIKKVKVDWVEWTTGFDEKLDKDMKYDLSYHFRTYKDDIKNCRNNCYDSLLIKRGKTMDPAKVQFTKSSVLKHFDDKELPSILETASMILRGKIKLEDIPTIRVATRSNLESDDFYTADNRRLFLFKVLKIKKVKVDWVEWNLEFEQQFKNDSTFDSNLHFDLTDAVDILDCRNKCVYDVCFKEKSERVFHVPSECVGYIVGNEGDTIRLFRRIFGANIKIKPSSFSLLLYSVSISKRMGSPNSFRPSAAKKRILKMVKKKYNSVKKESKNKKEKES